MLIFLVSDPLTDARYPHGSNDRSATRMLIACPNCATSYELAADALGAGRNVRCARCATTWFATPPLPAPVLTAEAGAPENWPAGLRYIDPNAPPKDDESVEAEAQPADAADALEHIEIASPPLAPLDGAPEGEAAASADPPPAEDVETVAARRARLAREADRKKARKPKLGAMIALAAAVAAALLGFRTDIVRLLPQTARLYAALGMPVNLRGLDIKEVKVGGETHEGAPVLVIEGKVVSKAKQTVEVPKLRFAVRGDRGVEIYAWTVQAETRVLGAGESLPFRTRLASPPPQARDVVVRFLHRRDF